MHKDKLKGNTRISRGLLNKTILERIQVPPIAPGPFVPDAFDDCGWVDFVQWTGPTPTPDTTNSGHYHLQI